MGVSKIKVPPVGNPAKASLWVVGEAPGWDEERERKPFVGQSGQLLREVMMRNGIIPEDVFITNVCQYRPDNNNIEEAEDTPEFAESFSELKALLLKYKPNCIALCGNTPLKYLLGKNGILNWRGSILEGPQSIKMIPSLHPAYTLRVPDSYPIFDKDWARIAVERKSPDLNIPEIQAIVDPESIYPVILDKILAMPIVSCDIETVKNTAEILCVGFGLSPTMAVVIPWNKHYAKPFCEAILSNPNIRKIFHNGAFDTTVLSINGIRTEAYTDDTIIQSHVLDPELPRDLGFLTSIYTRQPYYKGTGRASIPNDAKGWSTKRNKNELYLYNAKDCCVTYEIWQALSPEISSESLDSLYTYEMELVEACVELGIQGLHVDLERLELLRSSVTKEREKDQIFLNILAKEEINIKSTKALPDFLYNKLKLPARKSKEGKITANQEAIIANIAHIKGHLESLKTDKAKFEWKMKLGILQLILKLRERDKLLSSYLNITLCDNKAKSLYRVDGTESGRLSAKKYVDDSGLNLQTIPRSKVEVKDEAK